MHIIKSTLASSCVKSHENQSDRYNKSKLPLPTQRVVRGSRGRPSLYYCAKTSSHFRPFLPRQFYHYRFYFSPISPLFTTYPILCHPSLLPPRSGRVTHIAFYWSLAWCNPRTHDAMSNTSSPTLAFAVFDVVPPHCHGGVRSHSSQSLQLGIIICSSLFRI
jgi:hypothetical protein